MARIVDVLLHDQRAILTICSRIAGVPDCEGVTLALPHLVGGEGALATIPLSLDATEREALGRRSELLRTAFEALRVVSGVGQGLEVADRSIGCLIRDWWSGVGRRRGNKNDHLPNVAQACHSGA